MNSKDKKQYTPLHAAAAGGQSHAVKLLLDLGADVSAPALVLIITYKKASSKFDVSRLVIILTCLDIAWCMYLIFWCALIGSLTGDIVSWSYHLKKAL